jgi:hypothetical protein
VFDPQKPHICDSGITSSNEHFFFGIFGLLLGDWVERGGGGLFFVLRSCNEKQRWQKWQHNKSF